MCISTQKRIPGALYCEICEESLKSRRVHGQQNFGHEEVIVCASCCADATATGMTPTKIHVLSRLENLDGSAKAQKAPFWPKDATNTPIPLSKFVISMPNEVGA